MQFFENVHWESGFFLYTAYRNNFFELKKALLIQKKILWSKEIDLFTLKKCFWISKTLLNSKKFFLCPYIKEMFFWFKETVFWVYSNFLILRGKLDKEQMIK